MKKQLKRVLFFVFISCFMQTYSAGVSRYFSYFLPVCKQCKRLTEENQLLTVENQKIIKENQIMREQLKEKQGQYDRFVNSSEIQTAQLVYSLERALDEQYEVEQHKELLVVLIRLLHERFADVAEAFDVQDLSDLDALLQRLSVE